MMFGLVLMQLCLCFPLINSLTCAQTDDEGHTQLHSNPMWRFCVLITAANDRPKGIAYGLVDLPVIEREVEIDIYKMAFERNTEQQSILSLCLLERYNGTYKSPKTEYIFRCVCNSDRCNRHSNLHTFIKGLKHDNP
ncbi:unnamed protein product, partial [Mesorhabditis belari]|uniref:Uncharacterized protein n=1 Tax=Mesorhabditis belari TaxID=2138241 RepID=A0AAF3EDR7_9BILA